MNRARHRKSDLMTDPTLNKYRLTPPLKQYPIGGNDYGSSRRSLLMSKFVRLRPNVLAKNKSIPPQIKSDAMNITRNKMPNNTAPDAGIEFDRTTTRVNSRIPMPAGMRNESSVPTPPVKAHIRVVVTRSSCVPGSI